MKWRSGKVFAPPLLIVGVMIATLAGIARAASDGRSASPPTLPTSVTVSSNPCVINGQHISGTLYVVNSGGTIDQIDRKYLYTPFEKLCGIKINSSGPESLPKVEAMVAAHHVVWDVTDDYAPTDLLIGTQKGVWAPLPKGLFKGFHLAKGSLVKYGIWAQPYATAIAWSNKQFPKGKPQPTTAADFFNTTKFPGARCMDRSSLDAFELAELALGYNFKSKPYTINIPAALKKLDTIKSDVKLWWTTGNQPIDALKSGDCVITQVWNGRVFGANKAGADLGISFQASLIRDSWFHIIKNDPNPLAAAAFLRYINQPRQTALFANAIGYGGPNLDAEKYYTAAAKAALVTAPQNVAQLKGVTDESWWLKNQARADQAFNAWVTK